MNRWNIPALLEEKIRHRDQACVYCRISFGGPSSSKGERPSWEHIVNDARIITLENMARCCVSCNSSKRARELSDWLQSKYCLRKRITEQSVAQVVRDVLTHRPAFPGN